MNMDLNLSGVDISDLQAPAADLPAAEESFTLENLDRSLDPAPPNAPSPHPLL